MRFFLRTSACPAAFRVLNSAFRLRPALMSVYANAGRARRSLLLRKRGHKRVQGEFGILWFHVEHSLFLPLPELSASRVHAKGAQGDVPDHRNIPERGNDSYGQLLQVQVAQDSQTEAEVAVVVQPHEQMV